MLMILLVVSAGTAVFFRLVVLSNQLEAGRPGGRLQGGSAICPMADQSRLN